MASRDRALRSQAIKLQRARQMAGLPTAGFFSDLVGAGLSLIPGGGIIKGGIDLLTGLIPGGGSAGCSPGFKRDSQGRCVREGLIGTMERAIPGGATGFEPGTSLVPFSLVPGGVPATPIQGVRLDCPRGFVLGNDNNCYFKGALPRALRKWPPPTRPAITAGDMKTLTKANSLKGKIKTLATKSGFTCKARR